MKARALPPLKQAAGDIGRQHRLGGSPDFTQANKFPVCSCGKATTFHARLDSINDELCLAS